MSLQKFCFVCGAKMRLGYPGGDPENGPVEAICTKEASHPNVDSYVAQHSREYLAVLLNVLQADVELEAHFADRSINEGEKKLIEAIRVVRKGLAE